MVKGTLSKSKVARDSILGWIQNGMFSQGERLPSERELAQKLGMNHLTVRRGLAELAEKGLIVKHPSVGNFVQEIQSAELATSIAIAFPHYMFDGSPDSPINKMEAISRNRNENEIEKELNHHPTPGIFLNAIHRHLDVRRYSISTMFYRPGMFWLDVGQLAMVRNIKGVIVLGSPHISFEDIKQSRDAGIRIVMIGKEPAGWASLNLTCIDYDIDMALAQILNKLYELGHRKITVAQYADSTLKDEVGRKNWDETINAFLNQVGLTTKEFQQVDIPSGNDVVDFSSLKNILTHNSIPTAIVVPDEFAASVIFRQCHSLRLHIPNDLSLAATQDSTPHSHPVSLTAPNSVKLYMKIAELATQSLLQLLNGEEPLERQILLRSTVEWKASIGKPPVQS